MCSEKFCDRNAVGWLTTGCDLALQPFDQRPKDACVIGIFVDLNHTHAD